MAKKKQATEEEIIPKKITIHDELGQSWVVDKEDSLWAEVLTLTNNGKHDAVLPMSVIYSHRGWGWWSVFKTQDKWMQNIGIPYPDHNVLSDVSNLPALLQKFGGYVAFLEAQIGAIAGRTEALRAAYNAAVAVATASLDGGTEKSKEAKVLESSETLRQTKRLYIESEMLYETAKGLCASYQRAWETASRLMTARLAELETTSSQRTA